jgi:hypothetical protein
MAAMRCDWRLAVSLGCTFAVAVGCSELPRDSGHVATADAGPRVREIFAIEDPLVRASELAALLAQLDPEALPAVREAFGNAPLDRGDTEVVLLATWWARFDPEGARQWTVRDWTAAHISVLAAVLRTWAASDPAAAWTVAQQMPVPLQKEIASDAVIMGWQPDAKLDEFVASLSDATQQRAMETLARRRVVTLGAERALAWIEALPDPAFRELMRPRIAGAAAFAEPAVAAKWARPQITDSPRTSGLARRVGTRWVRSDPEAAMAWLESLPDGGDREDGVLESYRDWLATQHPEAVAWIERQPFEPWLEPAFSLYARNVLAFRDPKAALALAARFSDVDRRDTTTTYIARGWLERDHEAADAWLKQSNLPADVVQRSYALPNRKLHEFLRAQRPSAGAAATAPPE